MVISSLITLIILPAEVRRSAEEGELPEPELALEGSEVPAIGD
jgi:hypothetical protein